MAHCLDYAKIAFAVYFTGKNAYYAETPGHSVEGWSCTRWETGTLLGDGFQGGIYVNDREVVVGFCGTNTGSAGKLMSDLSADLRIAMDILPNQCTSALEMVRKAREVARGRRISVTGHSLGGGLSQVIAVWEGVPFVTFNAPPMKRALKVAKVNVFKPQMALRTMMSQKIEDTAGLNFRMDKDLVSSHILGRGHVGTVVDLKPPLGSGALASHGKDNCWQSILSTDWSHVDPFETF